MIDGNFAGFQEHKESLNLNSSLKSNGWNVDPKFSTCFCDVEIGGSTSRSARSSVTSSQQHYPDSASIRQSVITEETEEEVNQEIHNLSEEVVAIGATPKLGNATVSTKKRKSGVARGRGSLND